MPRLSGIGLSIRSGVTAVLGASGAGKSSLLSLLAGFERPTSGTIACSSKSGTRQLPLFWSPQDHGLWSKLTAREHLATVRPDVPQTDRTVDEWLALLRLDSVADALPQHLSQGERSRLSLGRALVSEAACLVLDEPLAHVDPIHCRSYLDLIAGHARDLDAAVVFSTHDPVSVLRIAESVICLSEARCVFNGPVNGLYFCPPTEDTAWLLGPANWIAAGDEWLRAVIAGDPPVCVRPHELVVTELSRESEPAGRATWLEVVAISRSGDVADVTVRSPAGAERRLFLTQCPVDVLPGSQVRLRCECDARRRGQ